jgi:hypothetical protein
MRHLGPYLPRDIDIERGEDGRLFPDRRAQ